MALNGISTLSTKEERQIAKLELAQTKRQQVETPGYRELRYYDLGLLPTVYDGNDIIDNPNIGGLVAGRPWTDGPPPSSNNTFAFQGDQNSWLRNGSVIISSSTFSTPAPSNPAYTYPDNTTGKTYNFTGSEWMSSPSLSVGGAWSSSTITVDYWFYPTANGIQLLSESNHPDVTSGYHYSMLETDINGYVYARFYEGTYPSYLTTSQTPVELNKWNHIYFTEDSQGAHSFELNGVPKTGNSAYTRIKPDIEYFVIGTSDFTNLGAAGRFQGKIGYLSVSDNVVSSTYSTYVDKFRPTAGSLSAVNGNYLEIQGTTSDWALSTTWTMEWWSKANIPSTENRLMGVFGQNTNEFSIDIFQQRGKLYLGKSSYTEIGVEPTPGVWTHVAIVSNAGTVTVYHNGASVYGPTAVGYDLTNATDKLYVGIRSQGNSPISQQAFSGQLTGIRITNTAVYSGTFDPLTVALPPVKVTGTRLLVNPNLRATVVDSSDSAHAIVTGVSISEYYPPSVQLTTGTSLSLSGSNQDVQVTGTSTDWALGTTWTVEWWEKIPYGASGFFGVMSQDSNDGGNPQPYTGPLGFDIYHANENIQMYNGRWSFAQPTQGVWNHIAIQNNNGTVTPYINGVATSIGQTNPTLGLTNSSNDLVIGLRSSNGTSPGYSQWFNGQLANIRISDVARYSKKFTPPTTVVVDANVKLALSGQIGGSGMLDDVSASNHTVTNNGTTVTSI